MVYLYLFEVKVSVLYCAVLVIIIDDGMVLMNVFMGRLVCGIVNCFMCEVGLMFGFVPVFLYVGGCIS